MSYNERLQELQEEINGIRREINILTKKAEIQVINADWKWQSLNAVKDQINKVEKIIKEMPLLEERIIYLQNQIKGISDDFDWKSLLVGLAFVGAILVGSQGTHVKGHRRQGKYVKGHVRKDKLGAKVGDNLINGSGYLLQNGDFSSNKEDLTPKEKAILQCDQLLRLVKNLKFHCENNIMEAKKYLYNPVLYKKNFERNQIIKIMFWAFIFSFLFVGLMIIIFS